MNVETIGLNQDRYNGCIRSCWNISDPRISRYYIQIQERCYDGCKEEYLVKKQHDEK